MPPGGGSRTGTRARRDPPPDLAADPTQTARPGAAAPERSLRTASRATSRERVIERAALLEWRRVASRVLGYGPAIRVGRFPDASPRVVGRPGAHRETPLNLTAIWYIAGFLFAGISFVFLTIGAAWLISHRNRGDVHKGLPYESGIDTYGDTHGRFGLSFYIYALLFVAFDIEVVFIYLWAIIFRDPSVDVASLFVSMLVFVAVLLLGLAYAWRKGVLEWR
jgi:NAD(P)H-quinone oxidoreductase subunit 3